MTGFAWTALVFLLGIWAGLPIWIWRLEQRSRELDNREQRIDDARLKVTDMLEKIVKWAGEEQK